MTTSDIGILAMYAATEEVFGCCKYAQRKVNRKLFLCFVMLPRTGGPQDIVFIVSGMLGWLLKVCASPYGWNTRNV
jgi:hypothetical protein